MNLLDYLMERAKRNDNTDLIIAKAQRSFTRWTLLTFAGVLWALFLGPTLNPIVRDLLLVLLGALINRGATQDNFWFGRPRGGIPDPANTTRVDRSESITTPLGAPASAAAAAAAPLAAAAMPAAEPAQPPAAKP